MSNKLVAPSNYRRVEEHRSCANCEFIDIAELVHEFKCSLDDCIVYRSLTKWVCDGHLWAIGEGADE